MAPDRRISPRNDVAGHRSTPMDGGRGRSRPPGLTPLFHQAGFFTASCVTHEKWCRAERRNSGTVASPTSAHLRSPGRTSRTMENADAAPQRYRSVLYEGRLEELRPSASTSTGIPSAFGCHGQMAKWTSAPASDTPDHTASSLSDRLSPRAARAIHAGI